METKDLDQKLRQRGRKKLEQELALAFRPILERATNTAALKLPSTATGRLYARQALELVQAAIIEELAPTYEQQEVDGFLDRVDGLKQQIEELDADLRG